MIDYQKLVQIAEEALQIIQRAAHYLEQHPVAPTDQGMQQLASDLRGAAAPMQDAIQEHKQSVGDGSADQGADQGAVVGAEPASDQMKPDTDAQAATDGSAPTSGAVGSRGSRSKPDASA